MKFNYDNLTFRQTLLRIHDNTNTIEIQIGHRHNMDIEPLFTPTFTYFNSVSLH